MKPKPQTVQRFGSPPMDAIRSARLRLQMLALRLEEWEGKGCFPDPILVELMNLTRDVQNINGART